jgi:hypothetical protein
MQDKTVAEWLKPTGGLAESRHVKLSRLVHPVAKHADTFGQIPIFGSPAIERIN